jgi:hypothetical protein
VLVLLSLDLLLLNPSKDDIKLVVFFFVDVGASEGLPPSVDDDDAADDDDDDDDEVAAASAAGAAGAAASAVAAVGLSCRRRRSVSGSVRGRLRPFRPPPLPPPRALTPSGKPRSPTARTFMKTHRGQEIGEQ